MNEYKTLEEFNFTPDEQYKLYDQINLIDPRSKIQNSVQENELLSLFNLIVEIFNSTEQSNCKLFNLEVQLYQLYKMCKLNKLVISKELSHHPIHEVLFSLATNPSQTLLFSYSFKIIKYFTFYKTNFFFDIYLKFGLLKFIYSYIQSNNPIHAMLSIILNYSYESNECCKDILSSFPQTLIQLINDDRQKFSIKRDVFFVIYSCSRFPIPSQLFSTFLDCILIMIQYNSKKIQQYVLLTCINLCTSKERALQFLQALSPYNPFSHRELFCEKDYILNEEEHIESNFLKEDNHIQYDSITLLTNYFIKSDENDLVIIGLHFATIISHFVSSLDLYGVNLPFKTIVDISVGDDVQTSFAACKFIEESISNETFVKALLLYNFQIKFMEKLNKAQFSIKRSMLISLCKLSIYSDIIHIKPLIDNHIIFYLLEIFEMEDSFLSLLALKAITKLSKFHIINEEEDIVECDFNDAGGIEVIQAIIDEGGDAAMDAQAFKDWWIAEFQLK